MLLPGDQHHAEINMLNPELQIQRSLGLENLGGAAFISRQRGSPALLISAADTQKAAARQRRRMPAFALVMFQILALSPVTPFSSARKVMIRAIPVSRRKRKVTHPALSAFPEEVLGRDTNKRAGVGFEGRVCYIQAERSRFCGYN